MKAIGDTLYQVTMITAAAVFGILVLKLLAADGKLPKPARDAVALI